MSAPLQAPASTPTLPPWPAPAAPQSAPAEQPPFAHLDHPAEAIAIDLSDGALPGLMALFIGLAGFGVVVSAVSSGGSRSRIAPAPASFEVRRISIAFDWTERARLQAALDAMAGSVNTESSAAFLAAAGGARDLLRSALAAARYAAIARFLTTAAEAESRYQTISRELAVRFREETHHDAVRIARGAMTARAEEGEGLVVVTLLVASAVHLPALPSALDRAALASALDGALPRRGDDLVAFEVIWSPSEDADRMSSAELETLYPDLLPLDAGDATIGRVQCGFCRALYPAELGRCPSCGAPVAEAAAV